jgi:flap endonuclease-1
MCILLGCDYLEPIKGVGPKTALKLIREHGDLGSVLAHLQSKQCVLRLPSPWALTHLRGRKKGGADDDEEDGAKKKKGGVQIPEDWPWEAAKQLFETPDVVPADKCELEWKDPDVDGLIQFLVTEKGFKYVVHTLSVWMTADRRSEDRVRSGAAKLTKFLNARQQGRLDGFFTAKPKEDKDDAAPAKGKGKAKGKDETKGTKRKVGVLLGLIGC